MCVEPSPGIGLCWEVDLDRKLLALAGHRSEKAGKVDLLQEFCQYFQYITVLLGTMFVIAAANIPLALFQPYFSFRIQLFSLHFSTPYSSALSN